MRCALGRRRKVSEVIVPHLDGLKARHRRGDLLHVRPRSERGIEEQLRQAGEGSGQPRGVLGHLQASVTGHKDSAIATVSGAEGGSAANLLKRQALQVGQFGCDVRHHVPRGDEAFGQIQSAYI